MLVGNLVDCSIAFQRQSLTAWTTIAGKCRKTVNVQLTKSISPKRALYNISWLYTTRYPMKNACRVYTYIQAVLIIRSDILFIHQTEVTHRMHTTACLPLISNELCGCQGYLKHKDKRRRLLQHQNKAGFPSRFLSFPSLSRLQARKFQCQLLNLPKGPKQGWRERKECFLKLDIVQNILQLHIQKGQSNCCCSH